MAIRPSDAVAARLGEHFADHRRDEASVTFLGTDPMKVLRYVPQPGSGDDVVWYCTLGCSNQPMDPATMNPDPNGPRAELVLGLRRGVDAVLKTLAIAAASPAVEGVVLRPGFLLDLETPLWPGAAFTGFVLEAAALPEVTGDWGAGVQLLQAVPVTQTEAAWVRLKGAAALREAWDEAGVDVTDPDRPAVNPR